MESSMSKIQQCMAVLLLALVGLLGGDYESRAAGDVSPVPVAEMQKTLRDLWVGHIFMIQHAVLYNVDVRSRRSGMPPTSKSWPT